MVNYGTSDLVNVNDATTEVFTILDGGKVGVGSSTPSTLLSLQGTSRQLRMAYDATNYTDWTVSSGGDLTVAPSGGDFTFTGTVDISGTTTVGIFTQGGGVYATSTANTTATLLNTEISDVNIIRITPNSAALTLTLPASSTLSTIIPNAGDSREWRVENGSSVTSTTIAGGIGLTLFANPTSTLKVLHANDNAILKMWRETASGNIEADLIITD